jgi:UDP-N-acetyl-D-mannosaminuronic acid dehydrogenase
VDPWFLIEMFPEETLLIQRARNRNDAMPSHVVNGIMELIAGTDNPKIALLGLAFKGNVDDMRESPSLTVVELLKDKGVQSAIHDPYVKNSPIELASIEDCFRDADCVVLLTDHSDYKYLNPVQLAKLVRTPVLFDTRNMLDHGEWRDAGFKVKVLGSGW